MDVLELIKQHDIAVSPSHNHSLGRWAACCWSVGFALPRTYYGSTLEEAVTACYTDAVVKRNIPQYDHMHRIIKDANT